MAVARALRAIRERRGFRLLLPTLILWLSVAAAAISISGVSRAQETGTLEGTLVSRGARQPLQGVRVTLEGSDVQAITDAQGVFRLSGVRPGPVVVVVRALGWHTVRRSIVLIAGQTARLDLELMEAPVTMRDVIVSANREAVRKAEVPANVGVVSGDDIRTSKPHHPAEIVGRVPGVLVVDLGGEGHTVAMRQPITYNPVYAYLEDGIPIRSTGFFNHNALYEINIPGAERIEVFKGPATALYGSDAIGGVVNILTRQPSRSPSAELFAEGGRFGYGRGLLSASNTWGAHGLRADVNVTRFDGWRDGTDQNRKSGTLRHDWRFGENARLKTVLTTSWIDSPGDGGSDVSRSDFDSRSSISYTPIAFRKVEALRFSTAYERRAGPWQWSGTAYARHNRLELLPNWQLTYDPQVWDTKNRSLGLLFQARRRFVPASANLTGGIDLDLSPGRRIIDEILPETSGPVFTSYTRGERQYDYDVTFRGISPYLQAAMTPAPKLHLSGGLRYDHVGYRYETRLEPLATGSHRRPASTSVDFDHVTPNVGVSWEVHERANVFASYRHGFRVPSEDQLFVQGSASNSVGLDPVRAHSWEGGARAQLGSIARIEASAYLMNMRDDILAFFNTTDFTSETSNAGRSRHWGIEVGVDGRITELRWEAAYSHSCHRYVQWLTATGVDYSGRDMEAGPRHLANGRLTWAPKRWARASITGEWVHVGEYFTDPGNTRRYGGYDLWNASGTFPVTSAFHVVARLNNVTDTIYANTASFNPFVPAELRDRFGPGMPRSLFLGMQYNWGGDRDE